MDDYIQLIQVLIWPIVVLILVFGFRFELRALLRRLSKLKYKDLEATFDKELSQVESRKNLYTAVGTKTVAQAPSEESEHAQLLRIAEVSPRAAITEAWRKLESVADRLATDMGMETKNPRSRDKAILYLIEKKQVNPSLLEDYNRLRKLRNQAAHAMEFNLSADEAERFSSLAVEMAGFLSRFTKKA
jgi:hypothetical protein